MPHTGGKLGATMKPSNHIGIRQLQRDASAVVARAAGGEVITITNRGRPVARLTPVPASRLQELVDAGSLVPAARDPVDWPDPIEGPSLSELLAAQRDEERY